MCNRHCTCNRHCGLCGDHNRRHSQEKEGQSVLFMRRRLQRLSHVRQMPRGPVKCGDRLAPRPGGRTLAFTIDRAAGLVLCLRQQNIGSRSWKSGVNPAQGRCCNSSKRMAECHWKKFSGKAPWASVQTHDDKPEYLSASPPQLCCGAFSPADFRDDEYIVVLPWLWTGMIGIQKRPRDDRGRFFVFPALDIGRNGAF